MYIEKEEYIVQQKNKETYIKKSTSHKPIYYMNRLNRKKKYKKKVPIKAKMKNRGHHFQPLWKHENRKLVQQHYTISIDVFVHLGKKIIINFLGS